MQEFKYELGLEARDKLTGFVGFIRFRAQFITGCNQYGLQPPVDKDGKIPDHQTVDENCVEIIGGGVNSMFFGSEAKVKTNENKGGPQPKVTETH